MNCDSCHYYNWYVAYTNGLDDARDGIYWKKVTYIKSLIVEFKQRAENNTERDGKIDVDKDGIVEDIEK